jgi:BlaI family transcriptional regulator, penicillinase repressor
MLNENKCRISEAEWLVMGVLWAKSPLTSTGIIEKLKPETKWSPKTIHSLMSRLVTKGALGVDKGVAPHHYFPLVTREQCVKDEINTFMKRFFNDSCSLMVTNFIQDNKISPDEIEQLKQILNQKQM